MATEIDISWIALEISDAIATHPGCPPPTTVLPFRGTFTVRFAPDVRRQKGSKAEFAEGYPFPLRLSRLGRMS